MTKKEWTILAVSIVAIGLPTFAAAYGASCKETKREMRFMMRCIVEGHTAFQCDRLYAGKAMPPRVR